MRRPASLSVIAVALALASTALAPAQVVIDMPPPPKAPAAKERPPAGPGAAPESVAPPAAAPARALGDLALARYGQARAAPRPTGASWAARRFAPYGRWYGYGWDPYLWHGCYPRWGFGHFHIAHFHFGKRLPRFHVFSGKSMVTEVAD